MPTLKQLEAFYLAASLGSFALAAQRLHVTQSSLSKRVAELELVLDCALFDRSAKRAQLTEAGQRLIPLVAQMLELKETVRSVAHDEQALVGICRFGITELGSLTWLPQLVSRVRREHPQLALHPQVDLARRLERQVVRGELDFAVVPGPPDDPRVEAHAISRVRFAWMASPQRMRPGALLKADDLTRHPVITQTDGSGLTRAFDIWAAEQGLTVQRIIASNSLMAIVGLTVADVGISFLPEDMMRPWVQRGDLVSLRSSPALPGLTYCFVHRKDDNRAVVRILRDCVAEEATFSLPAGFIQKSRKTTARRIK